jgi:RimJ/RimL family protein N-acetyltransferase
VILPENTASQAVARRLGFRPWEERTFAHAPELLHVIWRLTRDEYERQVRAT